MKEIERKPGKAREMKEEEKKREEIGRNWNKSKEEIVRNRKKT